MTISQGHKDHGFVSLVGRRWRTIGVTALGVLVGGAAYLHCAPPRYEASAKLLVMRMDQRLGGLKAQDTVPQLYGDSHPLDTQVEILQSKPVLAGAIARLGLTGGSGQPLSTDQLLASLRITPVKDTDVIEITRTGPDARNVAAVVNALCDSYQKVVEDIRRGGVHDGLELVDEQLATARKRLADTEADLLAFKRGSGTVDLPEQVRTSLASVGDLDAALNTRLVDFQAAKARVHAILGQLGVSEREALSAVAIDENPAIRSLQDQIVAAETSPLLQGLGPAHPDRIANDRRIARLKQMLAARIAATIGRRAHVTSMDSVRKTMIQNLVQAHADVISIGASLTAVQRARQNVDRVLARYPDLQLMNTRLQREVDVAAAIYQDLLQQREQARLSLAIAPTFVRVLEPAEKPDRPLAPLKGQAAPVLLLMALAAGYGAGLLRELTDRTIAPEELAMIIPTHRILATLPSLTRSELRQGDLVAMHGSPLHYVEAVRGLGLAIEDAIEPGRGRVVAITSASPGEGKTMTIANLGVCLAEAGNKVLIIDGDRHRPRLHELFDVAPKAGLAHVLQGKLEPAAVVHRVGMLDIVPSGATRSRNWLGKIRENLGKALATWRQEYDFVLLDLPPLAVHAEVAHLSRQADGLLFLADLRKTGPEIISGALTQLSAVKAPLLGTVVISRQTYRPYNRYLAGISAGQEDQE